MVTLKKQQAKEQTNIISSFLCYKWHCYHPFQVVFFCFLSLSFTLFSITCSELTEQKQLNIVIYPSITAPCLLLGNSIRLTQIIISSHLSLITLFYFHIFFSSFGSRTSCQRVIQRGMDVSNHHILFRAVAFSEARLIIAVSSTKKKKKKVRGACSSVISFSCELSVDQGGSV